MERILAYVVDSVVTFLAWFAVAIALAGGRWSRIEEDDTLVLIAGMLLLVVPFTYFVLAEGLAGTTVGKHVLGLRVVGPGGGRPGLFAATVRNVLRLAWALWPVGPAFMALDALLIQRTERDQRMGDAAAGTRVIRTRVRRNA
jgi:uncharacterized RDD family membrane protein YckC